MLTPYESYELAKPLVKLYEEIEDDILTSIAKRFSKNLEITNTSKWEIQMLAKMGVIRNDAIKAIAKKVGITADLLQIALEDAVWDTISKMEPALAEMAKDGIVRNAKFPPSESVQRALKSFLRQATDDLNLVNTVMQYKATTAWRQLVSGVKGYMDRQAVIDTIDRHTGATIIGAETQQQAVRKAITELIDKGIPAFVDKLGREWSPEAYISMDIRTTVTNAAHQAQFDRMDAYEITLIQTTSHAGARPLCADDQGKIFDRANKSTKYPHWSTSSYGKPAGILGINCGHFIYPFVDGISIQRYFPTEDRKENDRVYKESQKQRYYERAIRKEKQKCMAFDAVGDKEAFKAASKRLQANRNKLDDFISQTGRNRKPDREQVAGFGRSIAHKASRAART